MEEGEATANTSLMVEINVVDFTPDAESPNNISSEDALTLEDQALSRCPSRITLVEIAPDCDKISTKAVVNSQSCSRFHFMKGIFEEETLDKKLPRNVRRYYKQQQQLVKSFDESLHEDDDDALEFREMKNDDEVRKVVFISLFFNVLLVVGKSVASYLSGSLSIISSLVDSAMDLVSSLLFWYTNRSIKGTNFYEYPAGKTRLEPVAVVVLSVIMTAASIQLIINSVTTIINNSANPEIGLPTLIIIAMTIVIKFFLFLFCRRVHSPSARALAQDHRNDVLSNAFALGFGYLGYKVWKNADPIGAIVISLYIAYSWWKTGSDQVRSLTGHTAQPDLLQRLLLICMNHDNRIQFIDTLRAYHFGNSLLVEAHIVLPPTMSLHEAHDIGEPLQQKLEKFPNVERAFVHIDYEYEHSPSVEHKMGPETPK